MLFPSSVSQLKKVIIDFKRSTEEQGLKIHLDKTKVLTNQEPNQR